MDTMLDMARLIAFLLSFLGYGLTLRKALVVKVELIPAILVGAATVLMYVAGLIGIMRQAVWGILLGGAALLACSIVHRVRSRAFPHCTLPIGIAFLALTLAYFFFFLKDVRLIHQDNFSHWGLIVKQMWLTNRLPNADDVAILFKAYLPGSALFIYLFTEIVGKTEGLELLAQTVMMLSCISALGAFIGSRRSGVAGLITLILYMLYSFVSGAGIENLLVDTLLPLTALAGTAVIIAYRADMRRAALLSCPLIAMTLLIKSSGAFFSGLNMALLLWLFLRGRRTAGRGAYVAVALAIAIPIVLVAAWTPHVIRTFGEEAYLSRHAVSAAFYLVRLSAKSEEVIRSITTRFAARMTNLREVQNLVVIAMNAALLVLYAVMSLNGDERRRTVIRSLAAINVIYVLYMAGLLLTYLIPTSVEEALQLASYARYVNSILIYMLGIICMVGLKAMGGHSGKILRMLVYAAALCSVVACTMPAVRAQLSAMWIRPDYTSSERASIDALTQEGDSPLPYVVYITGNGVTRRYIGNVMKYNTLSLDLEFHVGADWRQIRDALPPNGTLIVAEEDENIRSLLSQFFQKDSYIGRYPLPLGSQ